MIFAYSFLVILGLLLHSPTSLQGMGGLKKQSSAATTQAQAALINREKNIQQEHNLAVKIKNLCDIGLTMVDTLDEKSSKNNDDISDHETEPSKIPAASFALLQKDLEEKRKNIEESIEYTTNQLQNVETQLQQIPSILNTLQSIAPNNKSSELFNQSTQKFSLYKQTIESRIESWNKKLLDIEKSIQTVKNDRRFINALLKKKNADITLDEYNKSLTQSNSRSLKDKYDDTEEYQNLNKMMRGKGAVLKINKFNSYVESILLKIKDQNIIQSTLKKTLLLDIEKQKNLLYKILQNNEDYLNENENDFAAARAVATAIKNLQDIISKLPTDDKGKQSSTDLPPTTQNSDPASNPSSSSSTTPSFDGTGTSNQNQRPPSSTSTSSSASSKTSNSDVFGDGLGNFGDQSNPTNTNPTNTNPSSSTTGTSNQHPQPPATLPANSSNSSSSSSSSATSATSTTSSLADQSNQSAQPSQQPSQQPATLQKDWDDLAAKIVEHKDGAGKKTNPENTKKDLRPQLLKFIKQTENIDYQMQASGISILEGMIILAEDGIQNFTDALFTALATVKDNEELLAKTLEFGIQQRCTTMFIPSNAPTEAEKTFRITLLGNNIALATVAYQLLLTAGANFSQNVSAAVLSNLHVSVDNIATTFSNFFNNADTTSKNRVTDQMKAENRTDTLATYFGGNQELYNAIKAAVIPVGDGQPQAQQTPPETKTPEVRIDDAPESDGKGTPMSREDLLSLINTINKGNLSNVATTITTTLSTNPNLIDQELSTQIIDNDIEDDNEDTLGDIIKSTNPDLYQQLSTSKNTIAATQLK